MKFKSNSDSTTRHPTPSAQSPSASGSVKAPSVPISVYRELAAELQATRAMVDSLNVKNQQLTQQNYQLRQEIERVVQSTLSLRQWVEPAQSISADAQLPVGGLSPHHLSHPLPRQSVGARPHHERGVEQQSPTYEETAIASELAAKLRGGEAPSISDTLFTEEAERPQSLSSASRPRDLGGIWLITTIVVIIVTAFGAGFLVVSPFLRSSR